MASSLPSRLIEEINAKYVDLGTRVEAAKATLSNAAPGAERRRAKQHLTYLDARLSGQLDIMTSTHNFDAQMLTREQLYHGTGFAPDALFIQVR